MGDRLHEFAWFIVGSAGVLVTGTVAVAIPVSRFSMCYEIRASDPPTCYRNAFPDVWLQTYQALLVASVLWLIASVVLPILIANVTRHQKYLSVQYLWLFVACLSGFGVGDWWTERQYPESYWTGGSNGAPVKGAIFWTLVVSGTIIAHFQESRNSHNRTHATDTHSLEKTEHSMM